MACAARPIDERSARWECSASLGLLALIFLRVPIAVALAVSGLVGYAAIDGWPQALKMFGAVPYHAGHRILAIGHSALHPDGGGGGARDMAEELFEACQRGVLGIRGALANATIGSCALFGAICGSSIATAATFSRVAIPEMRRRVRARLRGRRRRRRRNAGRPHSAIGLDRDLCNRRRAVTAEALRGGLRPGLRARRALCRRRLRRGRARPAWVPSVAAIRWRRVSPRDRHVEARCAVLLSRSRDLSGLVLAHRGGRRGRLRRDPDRLRHTRDGLAGLVDALLETVYITATVFFIVVGAFIFSRFIVLTRLPNDLARWVQDIGPDAAPDLSR